MTATADGLQNDPETEKVFKALHNPKWDLRTIPGLAKETGLSEESVRKVLAEKRELVRVSDVPDKTGQDLYAPKEKPVSFREFLSKMRIFIAKT
ncbi:MAG: hypothetical protein FJX61_03575 [Alphaproteobacteria bacterium]|nr:hypothetical protein [Alphaproteobacteria bacterium]